jgi:hypothetical protein
MPEAENNETLWEEAKTNEDSSAEPPAPPDPLPGAGQLRITARQFIRARGHRWERSAGFLLHQAKTLGREARLTCAEWQPLWEAFWQRTVR